MRTIGVQMNKDSKWGRRELIPAKTRGKSNTRVDSSKLTNVLTVQ